MMRKPDFFIIGKPKSGTTALYQFLQQHPQVFMSEVKEPQFFDHDRAEEVRACHSGSPHEDRYRQAACRYATERDYLRLFERARDGQVAGEASPSYIESAVAADAIHQFNPDARIIVLFREPVSFLQSVFYQNKRTLNEDADSLETAMDLEADRKAGRKLPKQIDWPGRVFYSERIKYAEQLERFLAFFPRQQISVFLYEDFRKDNAATVREIAGFLGIDRDAPIAYSQHNERRINRFAPIKRVVKSWQLRKRIKTWPPLLVAALEKAYACVFLAKPEKDDLDDDCREKLMRRFKPEVERFSQLLNEKRLVDKDLVAFWGYDRL